MSMSLSQLLIIMHIAVDAAYEGTTKRTFLAMSIMILAQLPFLMVFVCMYYRLSPPNNKAVSAESESEESLISSSEDECYYD